MKAQLRHDDSLQDDLILARRAGGGDRSAFEVLMRRHNRRLYRLARATLGDATEAEDALQDSYVNAYRSIEEFRGASSALTWLSRLVLNECLARQRRSARRHNIVPMVSSNTDVDLFSMTSDDALSPDRALARAQLRALLERKLDQLPESFRVVFICRSVEEMSVGETAACLDIPEATVRSRHFRAKSLLRESLAQEIDLLEGDLFEFGGATCDRVVAGVLARIQLGTPSQPTGL
jgi:RNA polymerase sigma-70 factor (ECF subfamily)